MLILVSDLHLADHPLRASFEASAFIREVAVQVDACPQDDNVRLILLGDIFELLKTPLWNSTNLRPWHKHSVELESFVLRLTEQVIASNERFFSGLRDLKQDKSLQVELLPGNHDGLLGGDSGRLARAALRRALNLTGGDAAFPTSYSDEAHGIWAQHGHEFDVFNSPSKIYPRFVAGDVVVVELVAMLPTRVACRLGIEEDDRRLRFLHELDNVLPQTGKGLVAWMQFGVSRLAESERGPILTALKDALAECISSARAEARAHGDLGDGLSNFLAAMGRFVASRGLAAASKLVRFEPLSVGELSAVHGRALAIAGAQALSHQDTFLFVAGHTHSPTHLAMPVGNDRVITYINSGTWRRVYLCVNPDSGGRSFATYNEESMLVVQKRVDKHPPAYDFRRQVRGL